MEQVFQCWNKTEHIGTNGTVTDTVTENIYDILLFILLDRRIVGLETDAAHSALEVFVLFIAASPVIFCL